MDIGSIFPVLTLILGWALNEVGSSPRLRRSLVSSRGWVRSRARNSALQPRMDDASALDG